MSRSRAGRGPTAGSAGPRGRRRPDPAGRRSRAPPPARRRSRQPSRPRSAGSTGRAGASPIPPLQPPPETANECATAPRCTASAATTATVPPANRTRLAAPTARRQIAPYGRVRRSSPANAQVWRATPASALTAPNGAAAVIAGNVATARPCPAVPRAASAAISVNVVVNPSTTVTACPVSWARSRVPGRPNRRPAHAGPGDQETGDRQRRQPDGAVGSVHGGPEREQPERGRRPHAGPARRCRRICGPVAHSRTVPAHRTASPTAAATTAGGAARRQLPQASPGRLARPRERAPARSAAAPGS